MSIGRHQAAALDRRRRSAEYGPDGPRNRPRTADPMSIGDRLFEARRAHGLTHERLAEASGVSSPYLSKIERNRALPSRPTLEAIVEHLKDAEQTGLLAERDKAELEQRGFAPEIVELVYAVGQLEPEARKAAVARMLELVE